jgi:hypothetical protein
MANESSESQGVSPVLRVFFVVAIIALAVLIWAYYAERRKTVAAQTLAAAQEQTIADLEEELDAEKAKPITFEYARPSSGDPAWFYVQVQAGKKVRFFNNTDADDMVVSFEAGAFPGLTENPFTVTPKDWVDTTVNEQAPDRKTYWVYTPGEDHGGGEVIVGDGP